MHVKDLLWGEQPGYRLKSHFFPWPGGSGQLDTGRAGGACGGNIAAAVRQQATLEHSVGLVGDAPTFSLEAQQKIEDIRCLPLSHHCIPSRQGLSLKLT